MQSVAATEPELLASLHDAARRCGRRKRSRPLRALVLRKGHTEWLRSVWSSYSGHLVHGAVHRLLARRWQRHALVRRSLRPHAAGTAARMPTLRPSPSPSAQKKQLARGGSGAVLVMTLGRYAAVQRWVGRRYGFATSRRSLRRKLRGDLAARAALMSRLLAAGERVAMALERPESRGTSSGACCATGSIHWGLWRECDDEWSETRSVHGRDDHAA